VPPPVQRPIPIWFGGLSDAVVTRASRLGDGWMPIIKPDAQAEEKLGALREQLRSFGRDPAKFGIEGWLRVHDGDPQRWAAAADGWRRLGADIVMLYPICIASPGSMIRSKPCVGLRRWRADSPLVSFEAHLSCVPRPRVFLLVVFPLDFLTGNKVLVRYLAAVYRDAGADGDI
jgi:hypothetical protein